MKFKHLTHDKTVKISLTQEDVTDLCSLTECYMNSPNGMKVAEITARITNMQRFFYRLIGLLHVSELPIDTMTKIEDKLNK